MHPHLSLPAGVHTPPLPHSAEGATVSCARVLRAGEYGVRTRPLYCLRVTPAGPAVATRAECAASLGAAAAPTASMPCNRFACASLDAVNRTQAFVSAVVTLDLAVDPTAAGESATVQAALEVEIQRCVRERGPSVGFARPLQFVCTCCFVVWGGGGGLRLPLAVGRCADASSAVSIVC